MEGANLLALWRLTNNRTITYLDPKRNPCLMDDVGCDLLSRLRKTLMPPRRIENFHIKDVILEDSNGKL